MADNDDITKDIQDAIDEIDGKAREATSSADEGVKNIQDGIDEIDGKVESAASNVSRRDFVRGLTGAGVGGLILGGGLGYLLAPKDAGTSGGTTGGGAAVDTSDIKIGSVSPVTGPYSGDGQEMTRGQQLAIDEINANGGIGGRKLTLVVGDVTDLAPENYVQVAQRLVNQEKVAAIFSGYCSNDSTEFPVYADAGLPVFHLNTLQANVDYVTEKKITNIYEGCPTEVWYGKGFVPLMQSWIADGSWKPSSNTAAIVTSNDPYSISIAQAFKKSVEAIGWTVPVYEEVTAPNADWGPILTKIRSNPPGLIYVTDYIPGDLASFAKQFRDAPTQSLMYQQYGPSVPEYLQLAKEAGYGVVWSTTIGTLPDDTGKAFLDLYKNKFGADAGLSQAGGEYDMVKLWAQTAAMAGDPYNFTQVNKLLKNVIYRGVSGTYKWISDTELAVAPYPDLINDPSLAMPHLTYQIQDGKQVAVFPEPYAQGKFQTPPWFK